MAKPTGRFLRSVECRTPVELIRIPEFFTSLSVLFVAQEILSSISTKESRGGALPGRQPDQPRKHQHQGVQIILTCDLNNLLQCTMCTLYSFFPPRPSAVGYIVQPHTCHIIIYGTYICPNALGRGGTFIELYFRASPNL